MRRLLVLTSVILLAAGCSTDKSADEPAAAPAPIPGNSAPAAAGDPGTAASAAPGKSAAAGGGGDTALKNNTEAICNQASKTSGDFASTLAENVKLAGDAASAKDAVAKQRAEQKMVRDVQNYSYALIDMSKLAGDKTVSTALAGLGEKVGTFKDDASKMNAQQLGEIRATLDKACGRG